MFRAYRLRRAHEKFLASCRILAGDRDYWAQSGSLATWLINRLSPIPALGLHEEGRGLLAALEWLEAHCRTLPLGEAEILHYHRLVYGERKPGAGEYRRHVVSVVGSKLPRSAPGRISGLMSQLVQRLAEDQSTFDRQSPCDQERIVRTAVDVHQKIGFIHPFTDCNGRVARLAMNHVLRRYGMGYVIFPPLSEDSPLWQALQKADSGDPNPLMSFARTCLNRV